MLTALILVCSLATVSDLSGCTRDNALDVVYVPATFVNPVTCLMHGQALCGRQLDRTRSGADRSYQGRLCARPDQQNR
jgi:hypothetical protein